MVGRRRHASLTRDERGAILVGGIFVMAFLVGALYLLIGASTAMQHGELMQDGVDSAAFSVAQMHAKGMNMIALTNMIKVAATATIAALPSIIYGAEETIRWIRARRWRRWRYGWVIPFLAEVAAEAREAYERASSRIPQILRAADRVQRTLKSQLGTISEEVVNREIQPVFEPPVELFFISPVREMPLRDESMSKLCERAYPYMDAKTVRAFQSVPSSAMREKAIGYARSKFNTYCMAFGVPTMLPDELPGEERYQLRVYAGGEQLSTTGEKGVQVATWGADNTDEISEMRDDLSVISFAQGEYYHSGRTSEEEALWRMNWRARLRRFEFNGGSISGDCARRGGPSRACARLPEFLRDMEWATVH